MHLRRIAESEWIRTAPSRGALAALAERPRRVLATVAAPSVAPALTSRLPVPLPLASLVRALGSRLVVANPVAVARLPAAVGALARSAVAAALRPAGPLPDESASRLSPGAGGAAGLAAPGSPDARRLAALLGRLPPECAATLGGGATWAAAALYEDDALEVRVGEASRARVAPEPPPMTARARHRLVLAAGRGAVPAGWAALDALADAAPAVAWPPGDEAQPWFVVRLLVSDAAAAAGMDAQTLARWAALTGRAGPGSRDRYWYTDSWERYREPGRVVGHVTPQVVGHSRRSGPAARAADDDDDAHTGPPPGLALTPDVERGVGVPPGYCLVDCAGLLEVAVVAA